MLKLMIVEQLNVVIKDLQIRMAEIYLVYIVVYAKIKNTRIGEKLKELV